MFVLNLKESGARSELERKRCLLAGLDDICGCLSVYLHMHSSTEKAESVNINVQHA